MTSARITVGLALQAAIVAEFIGSTEGLGYLTTVGQSQFDTNIVWAAIIVVIRMPEPPTLAAGPSTVKIAAPIAVPAPSITRSSRRTPRFRVWSGGAAAVTGGGSSPGQAKSPG